MSSLKELFVKERHSIKHQADVVLLCLHNMLVSEGMNIMSFDVLPYNWRGVHICAYEHKSSNNVFVIKSIVVDTVNIVVKLYDSRSETLLETTIYFANYINNTFKKFDSAYKDLDALKKQFQFELLEPLHLSSAIAIEKDHIARLAEAETSSSSDTDDSTSDVVSTNVVASTAVTGSDVSSTSNADCSGNVSGIRSPKRLFMGSRNPCGIPLPKYGKGDIDPLSTERGGMYFDPLRSRILPPTFERIPINIIDGARFDSLLPPELDSE